MKVLKRFKLQHKLKETWSVDESKLLEKLIFMDEEMKGEMKESGGQPSEKMIQAQEEIMSQINSERLDMKDIREETRQETLDKERYGSEGAHDQSKDPHQTSEHVQRQDNLNHGMFDGSLEEARQRSDDGKHIEVKPEVRQHVLNKGLFEGTLEDAQKNETMEEHEKTLEKIEKDFLEHNSGESIVEATQKLRDAGDSKRGIF